MVRHWLRVWSGVCLPSSWLRSCLQVDPPQFLPQDVAFSFSRKMSLSAFLPQDVAFSIHLSDNRFTARPLPTTVVSPPRKWAPWVDISSPQPASARFFAKWPLRACALYIPSLNNWQLTEVDGRAVKWVRRTVVEPLLKMYWHSDG